MDETTVNLQTPVRCCWMPRHQQRRLPVAAGPQGFHHVIGAINWVTEEVSHTIATVKNTQTFSDFLEHLLLTCYPSGRVVLVMDNAPYHRSAGTRALLSLFEPRVIVLWLPPYCPTLNPIERYWRHLKDIATANRLFPSMTHLLANLQIALEAQSDPTSPMRMSLRKLLT